MIDDSINLGWPQWYQDMVQRDRMREIENLARSVERKEGAGRVEKMREWAATAGRMDIFKQVSIYGKRG